MNKEQIKTLFEAVFWITLALVPLAFFLFALGMWTGIIPWVWLALYR